MPVGEQDVDAIRMATGEVAFMISVDMFTDTNDPLHRFIGTFDHTDPNATDRA